MFYYPFLRLLSGVMPHLQLVALVIPYSGTLTCDVIPVLALTRFTPFGSIVRGKGNPKIASIGYSVRYLLVIMISVFCPCQ